MKTVKRMAAVLVAVVLVLSLVGCGGGGLEGKYKLKSMSSGGMELTAEELAGLAALGGQEIKADEIMVLELKADGTFSISSSIDESMTGSGKYTVNGKELSLDVSGSVAKATVEGKTITLDIDGSTIVFTK